MPSPANRQNGAPAAAQDDRPLPVLAGSGAEPEVVDAEAAPLDRPAAAGVPAPVVAATGGFLAGFVTIAALRVLRRGGTRRRVIRRRRRLLEREIAGSRSFLVDVHVLKR